MRKLIHGASVETGKREDCCWAEDEEVFKPRDWSGGRSWVDSILRNIFGLAKFEHLSSSKAS